MYELWDEYMELEHEKKAKLCYMDTDSFIPHI